MWPQPQRIAPAISIAISPTGRRRLAWSSALSAPVLGGLRVRELEVRRHLLEVPHELIAYSSVEHGYERAQGFDGESGLVEVAILLGKPAVPEGRDRVE